MGALDGKIIFSTSENRPCWVGGRRAIFHRWTDSARPAKARKKTDDEEQQELQLQIHNVHALVEYEDGTVEREWPNRIHFADSADKFAQWDWDAMERERDGLPYTYEEQPAAEPDTQEPLQEIADVYPACESCAHVHENEEFCMLAGYDCKACSVRGCICKRCKDFNNWEAKA